MSNTLSWAKVEQYLAQKTESGNLMALIETEKIFKKVLEKLNFPGKTISQKIKGLKFVLSDYENFLAGREIYQRIISDLNFEPDQTKIEEILAYYYKAIEEIINFQKEKQNIILRLKIKSAVFLPSQPRSFLKKFVLILIIFFFIIFLLDSTKIGRAFAAGLVKISHFIFSWVLFAILILIGLAIIVIGVIFYLESRKKTRITKIEK